jgi:hypothetical protein
MAKLLIGDELKTPSIVQPPGLLITIAASHQSCSKTGKALTFPPVRSGDFRFNLLF